MKSSLHLPGKTIEEFARSCHGKMATASSKLGALEAIVEFTSPFLGDCRRHVMEDPDEISVSFVELLDQVVFELSENMPDNETVRGYVIDDLYNRLAIYLDCYHDHESYASNLHKRILTHEDTVIIRQCRMKEHTPLLMSEFHEQPALQRSILLTLLSLDEGELRNFYYTIAKESSSIEIKAMALAGLKKSGDGYRALHMLETGDDEYGVMIIYAKSFDCSAVERNEIPEDLFSLIFALRYVESNRDLLVDTRTLAWVVALLRSLIRAGYFNSFLDDLYRSICWILVFAGVEQMKELLRVEERLLDVRDILDFLPREFFDRIMGKVDLWGDEFIRRISGLLAMGKIRPDGHDSNSICYALWKTASKL